MDVLRLSKLLSFVLRHRPDALGVSLDREGFTDLGALASRITESGRLREPIDAAALARFVETDGASRFEIQGGRIRARTGHTAKEVVVARAVPVPPPEFLFFGAPRDRVSRCLDARGLRGPHEFALRLHESERSARRSAVFGRGGKARTIVVEAQRAARAGVVFLKCEPGVFLATEIPRRYLLSERAGFERQVSAGVVLVRRKDGKIEIALIRTKPRSDASQESARLALESTSSESARLPLVDEPRDDERRSGVDRRQEDVGPPGGVERRSGVTRRRRRRRGAWSAEGRMELPKGKIEPGEVPLDAAIRELREETGLVTPVDLLRELPRVRYAFRTPEGKSVYKVVHYFLLMSRDPEPVFSPQGKEGIVAVEWTELMHAVATIAFGNLKPVLESARDALAPGSDPPRGASGPPPRASQGPP